MLTCILQDAPTQAAGYWRAPRPHSGPEGSGAIPARGCRGWRTSRIRYTATGKQRGSNTDRQRQQLRFHIQSKGA